MMFDAWEVPPPPPTFFLVGWLMNQKSHCSHDLKQLYLTSEAGLWIILHSLVFSFCQNVLLCFLFIVLGFSIVLLPPKSFVWKLHRIRTFFIASNRNLIKLKRGISEILGFSNPRIGACRDLRKNWKQSQHFLIHSSLPLLAFLYSLSLSCLHFVILSFAVPKAVYIFTTQTLYVVASAVIKKRCVVVTFPRRTEWLGEVPTSGDTSRGRGQGQLG